LRGRPARTAPGPPFSFSMLSYWSVAELVLSFYLWVLKTGARWRDLPKPHPSCPTSQLRPAGAGCGSGEDDGIWIEAWQQLLLAANHHELLQWDETFLDGSFVLAKKGATLWEKNQAREEDKAETQLTRASPAEVALAESTLAQVRGPLLGRGR